MIEVTNCNIRLIEKDEPNKLKAVATITINDCFAVHDIRVLEGENGLFMAMPSKKSKDGKYRDIAHAINQEVRTVLENAILSAYKKALEEKAAQ